MTSHAYLTAACRWSVILRCPSLVFHSGLPTSLASWPHGCQHVKVPEYLADYCMSLSDVPIRQHLRCQLSSACHPTITAEHIQLTGLFCCRPVSLELVASQVSRSRQLHRQLRMNFKDTMFSKYQRIKHVRRVFT